MGDFYVGVEDKILTEPACKSQMTDDGSAWLSLDCTIGRIFGNPVAKEAIKDTIENMKKQITPFTPEMTFDEMMGIFRKMKLRDLLNERKVDYDEAAVNEALQKVPNI